MTERPILFSAPMIRALLAGTKTQTRRVVKPQPDSLKRLGVAGALVPYRLAPPPKDMPSATLEEPIRCPYGVRGDQLWVKERHRFDAAYDHLKPTQLGTLAAVFYEAGGQYGDGVRGKSRVSIHMRRCFSRISLQITEVRVERLNEISPADCLAEGIEYRPVDSGYPGAPLQDAYFFGGGHDEGYTSALAAYRALWEHINGPGSWAANPFVWAVSFERIT